MRIFNTFRRSFKLQKQFTSVSSSFVGEILNFPLICSEERESGISGTQRKAVKL